MKKPPSWDDDFDMEALTAGIPTAGKLGAREEHEGPSIGTVPTSDGSARMRGGPIVQPDGLHPTFDESARPPSTALVSTRGPAWLAHEPVALLSGLEVLLCTHERIKIEQERRALEMIIGWEQENTYHVNDEYNNALAHVRERNSGLSGMARRMFLGSRRPFHAEVVDRSYKQVLLDFRRPFSFFFSELSVETATGKFLGSVQRRFGLLSRRYDLADENGQIFATIKSPLWKFWTFPIYDRDEREVGVIRKEWSGFFNEAFTDYDNFEVDFGSTDWTLPERSVIFAAAMSIDFDFFENNHKR